MSESKNLVVVIGKPFKADDDLAKANDKLRREITKLYKEGIKNSKQKCQIKESLLETFFCYGMINMVIIYGKKSNT